MKTEIVKHKGMRDAAFWAGKNAGRGVKRSPLFQLKEACEKLGIHYPDMVGAMRRHEDHPLPRLCNGRPLKRWYDLAELKAFWERAKP